MFVLEELRKNYHRQLCEKILGYRVNAKAAMKSLSIADSSSRSSRLISQAIAEQLPYELCLRPPDGQTSGSVFGQLTNEFLRNAFRMLQHLRPGNWEFSTSQSNLGIARYDQYEHLAELASLIRKTPSLAATLGSDYFITPDIIVARCPLPDSEINQERDLLSLDSECANCTPLREINNNAEKKILHASISCKWTMRSDRSQNTRTEALNLIRNRRGKTPIIAVVTMEPMPTRLASIALGTGDIDCTYHATLPELVASVKTLDSSDQAEMLDTLIEGRRLRDISDLPLDLVT